MISPSKWPTGPSITTEMSWRNFQGGAELYAGDLCLGRVFKQRRPGNGWDAYLGTDLHVIKETMLDAQIALWQAAAARMLPSGVTVWWQGPSAKEDVELGLTKIRSDIVDRD